MSSALLLKLGLSPETVRRTVRHSATVVLPAHPRSVDRDRHLRTGYLDGEKQRQKSRVVAENQGMLITWSLQGMSVKQMAAALLVSEMTINSRLRALGVQPAPMVKR